MRAAEELFTALTHKQRTTLLELLETLAASDRGQARLRRGTFARCGDR
jgi:hypothetical protein